jgi:anthranilate 1,2-dioxygenase small subunit/terephthalate 1,2-dioxygenase oxygenase component beta subunit
MIDLISILSFNAAYAMAIDSDNLEQWPHFFTEDAIYRITNIENENENLPAGIVYADSRDMLEDRIAALRLANIYERQRYRHILGIPNILSQSVDSTKANTPFNVTRIMATGQMDVFATGYYQDTFVKSKISNPSVNTSEILLAQRVVICDSTVTDTLLALPL